MKKGTSVKFTFQNEDHTGIVLKGGKKVTVAFGHKGNSYRTVSAVPQLFKEIPTINLDESGIVDAYSLKGYKEAGGEETIRFEAKLCKNGKVIGIVSNNGCGGCNDYHHTNNATWKDIEEFNEAVKQWAIHYGDTEPFEPESNWIDWITCGNPSGQSAKLFWDYHKEYMAK